MNVFKFVSQYFWLICIGVSVINYLLMNRFDDSDEDRHIDRDLRRKYLGWFWGLGALPWLVAGYGQVTGGLPSVWAIFRPQDKNPYVWAFYASILFVYLAIVYWVLFRDGARIAAELRMVKFNAPGKSGALNAFWIKVIAVAVLPFFALWLWVASLMDVPLPIIG
jgi:hypothetical protein